MHEAELEEVQQLFEAVHPLSHEIHCCLRTEVLGQPGSAEATAFSSLLMSHARAMAVLHEVLWANEPQDDSPPASVRDDTEADCMVTTGEEWLKAIGWPENRPIIQLDPDRIPPELHALIPYAERRGIEDDVIRETVIDEADAKELEELVTGLQQAGIEQVRRRVLKMTVPEPISEEAGVFLAMLMAYDSARIVLSDPEVQGNDLTHRATDVLLFSLTHPRWAFVFRPKYAAYLNLIEPCWKVLRSLALKGRRFETWEQVCAAVQAVTAYRNAHRHPFVWGRRRGHRSHRQPGIASLPKVA